MLDHQNLDRKKIAVVGAGISGMSAAYFLSERHEVTLFEAAPRLGGHARTVIAGRRGDQPVDTGFIVFNYATYPHLTRLFRALDVPVMKSDMSFGASIDGGRLEYGLRSPRSLFAQRRNMVDPRFHRMIRDVLRFGREAPDAATSDDVTIGDLVEALSLGRWFRDYYLLPICGAIWSTPVAEVDRFPARSLLRFFRNHALLEHGAQHQWWTVKGGSIEYVRRLEAALTRRGCRLRPATPVTGVERTTDGIRLQTALYDEQAFDEVILACHSDQALDILGEAASGAERQALGRIRYQRNTAVLHRDPAQMPRRRACWSSWSYRSQAGAIGVTYWMNRLQGIADTDPLFVTLNPTAEIPDELVYDTANFAHPVFDLQALQAQQALARIQGHNRTWFAGAYHRHGFHEDGIASALRVVRLIDATTPAGPAVAQTDRPEAEGVLPVPS